MAFDKMTQKIAITVPQFTLLKGSDGLFRKQHRYNEPYIVSFAIDESGEDTKSVKFNYMPFPKVKPGGSVIMLGDGHLVYGPKQPGDFAAVSILLMESDQDMRDLGKRIEDVARSKFVDLGLKMLLSVKPEAAGIIAVLKELTQLVSGALKNDGDDELFRTEGTFLRDLPNPYHVNREYRTGNDFVDLRLRILPMEKPNGQGAEVKILPV